MRSGPFQTGDTILAVAMALERRDELEGGAIRLELKTRAAWFLETGTEDRIRVCWDIGEFYDGQSAIVHKRKKPPSAEVKNAAFTQGCEMAMERPNRA